MNDLRRRHLMQLLGSTLLGSVMLMAVARLDAVRAVEPVAAKDSSAHSATVAENSVNVPDPSPEGTQVDTPQEAPAAAAASPANRDEGFRSTLVGFWNHVENGQHYIENRADGTSRMLLKLDFVASLLYGGESTMQLTWEVKDGVLTHTVIDGNPKKNVDAIVRDYGKVRAYTIIESTEQRMLLEAHDTKRTRELWTRVPPPKEWE